MCVVVLLRVIDLNKYFTYNYFFCSRLDINIYNKKNIHTINNE
jgi:hypothetical protein